MHWKCLMDMFWSKPIVLKGGAKTKYDQIWHFILSDQCCFFAAVCSKQKEFKAEVRERAPKIRYMHKNLIKNTVSRFNSEPTFP